MALFSKEPENNPKTALKPTMAGTSPAAPTTAPLAPPVSQEAPAPRPVQASPSAMPAPADARAYLDRGSKISGKLFFEGPVRIDGQVDGEISANDSVIIGEAAVVTAQVKAASVVIAGKISGDIMASKRLEIRPTAKVFGNLTSPILVVHDGALFEGHCTMHLEAKSEGRTELKDDRKVTPIAPKEERVVPQAAVAGNKSA
jgi:cytoskeletal protein CcmA (bactofilin family)